MFDKSRELFPVKEEMVYLANCGIAPLYNGAAEEIMSFSAARSRAGVRLCTDSSSFLSGLRDSAARLMRTSPADISFMKNTAEAMSIIANGYPLKEGDEIISYVHEYPSNHYPWLIQQRRGAKLVLLGDADPIGDLSGGRPRGWSMADLARAVTDRTRLVAISHAQFTSGYAADLEELGKFCSERSIDTVVDVAQSLGALPVYPEQWHISAVAGSGWK